MGWPFGIQLRSCAGTGTLSRCRQTCAASHKVKSSQSHDFDFFGKKQKSQSHDFDFFVKTEKSQSRDFDFFEKTEKSQSHDFDFDLTF
jgi:hypothetical protein